MVSILETCGVPSKSILHRLEDVWMDVSLGFAVVLRLIKSDKSTAECCATLTDAMATDWIVNNAKVDL